MGPQLGGNRIDNAPRRRLRGCCLLRGNRDEHFVWKRIDEPRAKEWRRVALRFDERHTRVVNELAAAPVRVLLGVTLNFSFTLRKDSCLPLCELWTSSESVEWKGRLRA